MSGFRNKGHSLKMISLPEGTFIANGDNDPLPYYYKPFIGSLYRYRIQQGLSLLSPPYPSVLEFGYGSGLLLPTLHAISDELYGVDIESHPETVQLCLKKNHINASLYKCDLLETGFPDHHFDLIVAFSVFEHISDCRSVLQEMNRILKPGGHLLVGMPRVDKIMTGLFKLIGYNEIDDHHVIDHKEVLRLCLLYFDLEKKARLFPVFPDSLSLYFNMLFKKKSHHLPESVHA